MRAILFSSSDPSINLPCEEQAKVFPHFTDRPQKSICRNIKHSTEYEGKVEKMRELKRCSIPKSNF